MSTETDAEKRTHFYIEHKLSSLHTAGNVCMTWWVSSVVFSGTILAAVWLQRIDLRNSTFMMVVLGFVLTGFFFGVTFFGYLVIRYLETFKEDVNSFAKRGACLSMSQRSSHPGVTSIIMSEIKGLFQIGRRKPERAEENTENCTEGDVLICQLFHTEIDFFISGMRAGTRCFALITIAWFIFWASLFFSKCCRPPMPPTQAVIHASPSRLSSTAL